MNRKTIIQLCAVLIACLCMAWMAGCAAARESSASTIAASVSASSSQADAAVSNEAAATSSGSSSAKVSATAARADGVVIVGADEVANRDDNAYLVDARTAEEFAEGHIPGALNASYPKSTGGPCQADENATAFRSVWAKLGIPQDAKVILYCRTSNRSSAAASALAQDGYTDLYVYDGGWADWTSDSSRPVEK